MKIRRKPKNVIICIDYSQLEIRVMAMRSRDKSLCEVMNDPKGDIHTLTAEQFGVDRGTTAKPINFLIQYGGGAYMLAEKLTLDGVSTTESQAKEYINKFEALRPGVKAYRLDLIDFHMKHGFVYYMTGRTRSLGRDYDWMNKKSFHKGETTLANNTIQGDGQDLLKASVNRLCHPLNFDEEVLKSKIVKSSTNHKQYLLEKSERVKRFRRALSKMRHFVFMLQIHDEVLFSVSEEDAVEAAAIVAEVMTWKHYLPVPKEVPCADVALVVEGGIGRSWGEAKGKSPLYSIHAGFGEVKVEKKG